MSPDLSLYRTVTYWPPGSWEIAGNVPVLIQGVWTHDDSHEKVYLLTDVAEGGYLYNGEIRFSDPRALVRARRIEKFVSWLDMRSLRQVRVATVGEVSETVEVEVEDNREENSAA